MLRWPAQSIVAGVIAWWPLWSVVSAQSAAGGGGEAPPAEHVRVRLDFRDGDCIDHEALTTGVTRMLGRPIFVDGDPSEVLIDGEDVRIGAARAVRFVLTTRDGRVVGRRALARPDGRCEGLVEEAVVVLALLVDLERSEVVLNSQAPPVVPGVGSPSRDAQTARSGGDTGGVPAREGPTFGGGISIGAVMDTRSLPNVTVGPAAELWLETPWPLDVRVTGHWLSPQQAADERGRGLSAWLVGGSAGLCLRTEISAFVLGGCGGIVLDFLTVTAFGLADAVDGALRPTTSAELTLLGGWTVRSLVVRLHAGATMGLETVRFTRDLGSPQEAVLHSADALGVALAVTVGLRIPSER